MAILQTYKISNTQSDLNQTNHYNNLTTNFKTISNMLFISRNI